MALERTRIDECIAAMAAHENAISTLEAELVALRAPASQRTFNVVELHETILEQLPLRDLLLAQRVSKDWQAAIVSSKKLQSELFFRPLSTQILDHDGGYDSKWKDTVTGEEVVPDWNPLLEPIYFQIFEVYARPFNERLPTEWLRPEASWRKMLRSQPPSKGTVMIQLWEGFAEERLFELGDNEITAFEGPIKVDTGAQKPAHQSKICCTLAWSHSGLPRTLVWLSCRALYMTL